MQATRLFKQDQDHGSRPCRVHLFPVIFLISQLKDRWQDEIMRQPGPLQSKDGFCAFLSKENSLKFPFLKPIPLAMA